MFGAERTKKLEFGTSGTSLRSVVGTGGQSEFGWRVEEVANEEEDKITGMSLGQRSDVGQDRNRQGFRVSAR